VIFKKSTRVQEIAFAEEVLEHPDFFALPEKVQRALRNHVRGLRGEKETAFMLDRKFGLDNRNHLLLHDLRLSDGLGGFAQFDHIVFARLSRTAAIVESKNYAGRISKNEHGEWCVWYRGQRRPQNIPNPVEQVRRQRDVLEAWLRRNGWDKAFERVGVFVAIMPDAEIDRSKIGSDQPIYKADNLFREWLEFGGTTTLGRLFSSGVTPDLMLQMGKQLAAAHVPEEEVYIRLGIAQSPDFQVETPSAEADDVEQLEPDQMVALASEPKPDPEPFDETASAPDLVLESAPTNAVPEQIAIVDAPSSKAGPAEQVCLGISQRQLPDGRIAFRANRNDDIAKEALASVCKGRAMWNPRFYNWICLPEAAAAIRDGLPAAIEAAQQP
jgi:hypothetical protein